MSESDIRDEPLRGTAIPASERRDSIAVSASGCGRLMVSGSSFAHSALPNVWAAASAQREKVPRFVMGLLPGGLFEANIARRVR